MRLVREYFAGADELYRAFVDPARLQVWFQPAPGLRSTAVAGDAGGDGVELVFDTPIGEVHLRLVYRERDPDRRLAFDLQRRDPGGERESRVTIELVPKGEKVRLALEHVGVGPDERAETEASWRYALGRLIGACPRAMDAYYARLEGAPGYHSRFGGLWPDRLDAEQLQADKQASGALGAEDAQRFEHWREHGYVVLENAVPAATIDAFREEVARDWQRGNPRVTIELCEGDGGRHQMLPAMQDRPSKVLDYHAVSSCARDIQFAPPIRRFLELLFERSPMAFQSLLFQYGTEQDMHQDTAYVVTRSPMQFVGCWVALEDVVVGSGELHYYDGSHRIPEYLWFDRGRCRPPGYDDHADFLAWVREQSEAAGCRKVTFLPKQGDALLWHADLVHGGSPRVDRELTRRSLVTHYCPVDVDPAWMTTEASRERREHAPGAFYCSQLEKA